MSQRDRSRKERSRNKWGGGHFVGLPRRFIESHTLASLSPYGCKLLLDLLGSYSGLNNGNLSAAWTLMRRRGWKSKATLWKAIRELTERGILVRTRHGNRRQPHLYCLSMYCVDETRHKLDIGPTTAPLNTWLRDEPLRPIHELQAEHEQKQRQALHKLQQAQYMANR